MAREIAHGDITGMKLDQAARVKTAADDLAARRDALLDLLAAKENDAFVRFLLANQDELREMLTWYHYLPITEEEAPAGQAVS